MDTVAFSMGMSAFFADRYYTYLKKAFGEQGRNAFLQGFHHYATQRGRRMAQRVIRDGLPLTYESYCQYPEVVASEDMKPNDPPGRSEKIAHDTDFISHVYACPVHAKFAQMGTDEEISVLYCSLIDIYQCEGYNPEIKYHVDQTLNTADYCIHRIENACLDPQKPLPRHTEDSPPFPYICANFFYSVRESIVSIFGDKGAEIAEAVRQDFIAEYGQADWDEIETYKDQNFNVYYRP